MVIKIVLLTSPLPPLHYVKPNALHQNLVYQIALYTHYKVQWSNINKCFGEVYQKRKTCTFVFFLNEKKKGDVSHYIAV